MLTTLRDLTSDGWLLFATRSIRLFAYGGLSVVLVFYLVSLGLTESDVGLLLTVTLLGDTLISLILTTQADRIGRRRMLIVGALMAAAGLVFGFTARFWLPVIAGTIGVISPSGQEVGPFLSIEQAAMSQVVSDRARTNVFAWYTMAGSLATALGALAASALTQALQTSWAPVDSHRAIVIAYSAAPGYQPRERSNVRPFVRHSVRSACAGSIRKVPSNGTSAATVVAISTVAAPTTKGRAPKSRIAAERGEQTDQAGRYCQPRGEADQCLCETSGSASPRRFAMRWPRAPCGRRTRASAGPPGTRRRHASPSTRTAGRRRRVPTRPRENARKHPGKAGDMRSHRHQLKWRLWRDLVHGGRHRRPRPSMSSLRARGRATPCPRGPARPSGNRHRWHRCHP